MEKKGKLIIIEAGDGSGKATQTKALYEHLCREGYRVHRVEFPDYAADSSMLVRMYLRGDFGGHAEDVNAYAASTFFAVDRYASYPSGKLIDEPCKQEGHYVSQRSRDHCYDKCVFYTYQEYIVFKKKAYVVVESDESRWLKDVVVSKAEIN